MIATARRAACIAAGILLLPVFAGCGGAYVQETVLPARIDYACTGNRVLPVARAADGRQAVVMLDGKQLTLARADSAAQEKYSNGGYALYLDGERAMLEQDGRVLFGPCNTPGALPTAPRYR
jgi:membrane-bound inhibitor of C-type lysozyme